MIQNEIDMVICPNMCFNGKIKYYSNRALFDLITCQYCKGEGLVKKVDVLKIEKSL